MSRFVYENLTSDQLRIGVALLNQEGAVVEALEAAADKAVTEALAPFGLNQVGAGIGRAAAVAAATPAASKVVGGAQGGARAQSTKSAPRKKGAGGPRVSPAQLESRRLQGLYIAAIRSVPTSRRNKYKALVKGPGGRQAAIDAIHRDYTVKA